MSNESTTPGAADTYRTELAAEIVMAYVANNVLPAKDLPGLIGDVYGALLACSFGLPVTAAGPEMVEVERPTAAQIKRSVTPDAIISFVDGRSYKSMKRHLGTHGLTPESYRTRYGLPADYPMVAPNYAAQRSALAKSIGLGRPGSRAEQQAA